MPPTLLSRPHESSSSDNSLPHYRFGSRLRFDKAAEPRPESGPRRSDVPVRAMMRAWALAGVAALIAALALVSGNASAQTPVCTNTPASDERIECTEDADSTDDIDITVEGVDIDTMEDGAPGVYGHHEGTGDIFIDFQSGLDENGDLIRNDIDTTGVSTDLDASHGVYARHVGSGGRRNRRSEYLHHHDGDWVPWRQCLSRLPAKRSTRNGSPAGGCRQHTPPHFRVDHRDASK